MHLRLPEQNIAFIQIHGRGHFIPHFSEIVCSRDKFEYLKFDIWKNSFVLQGDPTYLK